MRTIGLLGGMSWESTAHYYRFINQGVRDALGGLHSAEIVLRSIDFDPIAGYQRQDDWEGAAAHLIDAANGVAQAGAECLLICTNTMHKVADEIAEAIPIPLLHIADATAEHLVSRGVGRVGLLGTAFTMEQDFYKGRLREGFALEVLTPEAADQTTVHRVIYDELCQGKIRDDSKAAYLKIIDSLADCGAQAVILGCTEIGLLIQQDDTSMRLVDTTEIHAAAAVEWALSTG